MIYLIVFQVACAVLATASVLPIARRFGVLPAVTVSLFLGLGVPEIVITIIGPG